jgi:hypothetical protein
MKKITLILAMGLCCLNLTRAQTSAATVNGKKGGSTSMGNHQASAKGSKGGSAAVNKNGVKIKGKNGGGVDLGKKK